MSTVDERIGSIPIAISYDVELTDGGEDVLFWIVDGTMRVHPSNIERVRLLVKDGRVPFKVRL